MILSIAKPPSCLYMYACMKPWSAQLYRIKYCDKTVDAEAGSHVCIWRESGHGLTHVLKQTVSIGYHKEKRYTFVYSLSASTIYHRILQFRNDLTRLWDDLTRLWVCAGQTESLLFIHATWRHIFLAGMCTWAKPPIRKDVRTTDDQPWLQK